MIINRIKAKFHQLTPAQKKAAHYIQHNINTAAFLTAKEIGVQSGCSEPTIHRLAKVIGYNNYIEMSKSMKECAFEKRVMKRFNNMVTGEKDSNQTWINKHFALEINNINETLQLVTEEKITQAVQMIINAERVYIAGWRAGLSVTSFMSYVLHYILGNTYLIPQGEAAEYINYIKQEDLLITTGFPRYCKTTLRVCELAKEKGANIITFTDSEISPFYELAEVAFITETSTRGMIDSYVAPLSLVNLITNEVAYQKPELVRKNIEDMEQSLSFFDLEYNWK